MTSIVALGGIVLYPERFLATSPRMLATVSALVLVAIVVSALLAARAMRRESVRADASAQLAEHAAAELRRHSAELESRVEERTREVLSALTQRDELVSRLAALSVRDPLTGLHNRRFSNEELPSLIAGAERHQRPLSLAIADLDWFKNVNDNFSYSIGDEVLRRFANILTDGARRSDRVSRYGGEEFLIVMPETSVEDAVVLCQRVCDAVRDHPWEEVASGLKVTVSIGVADSLHHPGLVNLIAAADEAIHRAKTNGRDQVATTAPRVWAGLPGQQVG